MAANRETRQMVCPMHAGTKAGPRSCGGELVSAKAGAGIHRSGAKAGRSEDTWTVAPCSSLLAQGWQTRSPQGVLWASSPQLVLAD